MSSKRDRSKNFTPDEEEMLVNLANKYKTVLENKKSDSQTGFQKKEVWNKIAVEYNVVCPRCVSRLLFCYTMQSFDCFDNFQERTAIVLRNKYDNIKKSIRQKAAKERSERLATGGGRAPEPSTQRSEALSELEETISLSVKGHESNFDDDAPPLDTNPSEINENIIEETEYIFDAEDVFNEIEIDNIDFLQNVSTIEGSNRSASAPMIVIDDSMSTSELSIPSTLQTPSSKKLWSKYTPASLKKPIRSILKTKGKFTQKEESQEESLLDLKKKFLCREMELMEERATREMKLLEEKAAREKEEHELKMKILKAEYDKKKQSENE